MPLARRYERVRELGRGSFGTVWLVKRRCDRKLFAMKTLELPPLCSRDEKDLAERRQALREVEILQSLESPYIVRYHETLLVPATAQQERSELHLFTEYCDAGDLAAHLRKARRPGGGLPEAEVWRFAVAMLRGLCELHRQNVLHRDLKPANVFLSRAPGDGGGLRGRLPTAGGGGQRRTSRLQAKLGDLGLARSVSSSAGMASTVVGTPHYIAPEIYEGLPYDEKADVYSFGACVYELMHGKPPWAECQHVAAIVRHVLKLDGDAAEHEVSMDLSFSADLRALVTACMARSPSERPSAPELLVRVPPEHGVGAEATTASCEATALAAPAPGPVAARALPPGPPPPAVGFAFRPSPRGAAGPAASQQEALEVTMSPAELGGAATDAPAPRGSDPPAALTAATGPQDVTLRPAPPGGCGEEAACAEPAAADQTDETMQLSDGAPSGDPPAAEEARDTRLLQAARAAASPEPSIEQASAPCDSALLQTRPRLQQTGHLKTYMASAQNCISRWRRDRRGPLSCPSEDAEASRSSGGGGGAALGTRRHCALRSPASAKARQGGYARESPPGGRPGAQAAPEARLLEVVGVAISLSPKVAHPLRL